MELAGQVAIVTGGAGVLGRAFAGALARAGADVALVDVSAEALAGAVAETEAVAAMAANAAAGQAPSRRFLPVVCDVRAPAQVQQAVAQVRADLGRVDILVNSAGGSLYTPKDLLDVTEEHWDLVLDVNLKGTFLFCQAVAPLMRDQGGGRIINLASIAGRTPSILGGVQYGTAKAGVIGLTRRLAKEVGPWGINVNAIAPGVVLSGERVTNLWQALTEGEREATLGAIPLGRLSTPEEQADVVVFLAGPASRYITGAIIDVNGGRFMG